jgi:hypothetical protein
MSSVGMASGMNPSASADLVAMTFNSMDTPTNRNTRAKAIAGNPNATDENEQADAQAAVAGQSSESGMEYTPGVNSPGTMQRVEQLRNKEAEDWQKKYGTSLIGAKLYGILNKARNAKQSKVPDPDGGVNGIPGPGIGGFDDEPTPPVSVIPWRRAMMLGNDNQSSDSNTSTPTGSNSNGSGDNSVPPSGGGDNKGGGGGSNGGNGGNGGSGGGGGGDNEDDEDKKGTSGRKFPLPFSIAQPVNENIKTFLEYVNKNVPDSEDIEMELVDELKSANDEDLKEYPGERGETAHKNLHSKIKSFINTMEKMHESKDGDYEGLPEEKPMSDKELDDYYKSYTKDKKKLKKNK